MTAGYINTNATARITTTDATASILLTVPAGNDLDFLIIDNTGSGTGDALVSLNAGSTYTLFVRAGKTLNFPLFAPPNQNIMIKRDASTDLVGVFACLLKRNPN